MAYEYHYMYTKSVSDCLSPDVCVVEVRAGQWQSHLTM